MFPKEFITQLEVQWGREEAVAIVEALSQQPITSIRKNSKKSNTCFDDLESVPWCTEGRYLPQRISFTLDPSFHAGTYYVQEASSMFLKEAVMQSVDVSKRIRALDMCAAPGGKSTLLASCLTDDSLLVANEVVSNRVVALRENLIKWGYPNVLISKHEVEDFKGLEGFFDLMLIDAPCSGEGMFRKDSVAVSEWSLKNVEVCYRRQQRILTHTADLLKEGGILIYSTCTFNRFENDDNVRFLMENFDFEKVELNIPDEWNIAKTEHGYSFLPHKTKGEGFYLSVLRKKTMPSYQGSKFVSTKNIFQMLKDSEAAICKDYFADTTDLKFLQRDAGQVYFVKENVWKDYALLNRSLRNLFIITAAGESKGKNIFIPSHELALSQLLNKELPGHDFSKEDALQYLRKNTPILPDSVPNGWLLARYENNILGWFKSVQGRMNNYLPTEWRIKKL